jgi:hypothetical protein
MIDTDYNYTTADLIDAEEEERHASAEWFAGWRYQQERIDYLPEED